MLQRKVAVLVSHILTFCPMRVSSTPKMSVLLSARFFRLACTCRQQAREREKEREREGEREGERERKRERERERERGRSKERRQKWG